MVMVEAGNELTAVKLSQEKLTARLAFEEAPL